MFKQRNLTTVNDKRTENFFTGYKFTFTVCRKRDYKSPGINLSNKTDKFPETKIVPGLKFRRALQLNFLLTALFDFLFSAIFKAPLPTAPAENRRELPTRFPAKIREQSAGNHRLLRGCYFTLDMVTWIGWTETRTLYQNFYWTGYHSFLWCSRAPPELRFLTEILPRERGNPCWLYKMQKYKM